MGKRSVSAIPRGVRVVPLTPVHRFRLARCTSVLLTRHEEHRRACVTLKGRDVESREQVVDPGPFHLLYGLPKRGVSRHCRVQGRSTNTKLRRSQSPSQAIAEEAKKFNTTLMVKRSQVGGWWKPWFVGPFHVLLVTRVRHNRPPVANRGLANHSSRGGTVPHHGSATIFRFAQSRTLNVKLGHFFNLGWPLPSKFRVGLPVAR